MPHSPARRDALNEAVVLVLAHLATEAASVLAEGPFADAIAARVLAQLGGVVARGSSAPAKSPYLTQREAATYTGRSISSLRRARSEGLPFGRVGGNVTFEREVLDRWMRGEGRPSDAGERSGGAASCTARGPPQVPATTSV